MAVCVVDSTRALRVQLMSQLDSLQAVLLSTRLSPDGQRALEARLSEVIVASDRRRSADALDANSARSRPDADRAARHGAGTMAHAERMFEAQLQAVTLRGWIGINPLGKSREIADDNGVRVRYLGYPRIESVDPNSPAEHAGVLQGDVLLAFDGTDVTMNDVPVTKLFQPDHKLTVRVRRKWR